MEPIRNTTELYARMESLSYYKEMLAADCCQMDSYLTHKLEGKIVEAKRSIRKWYREHKADYENDPRMVRDDGMDGCVVLVPIPETISDAETAEEWFRLHEYTEIPNGPYDCTGKLFTVWFKVIRRHGRYYAYHSIGCDC